MVDIKLNETSGLSLAYLGDAIWELVVREYLVATGNKVDKLNKIAVHYVNAKGQSEIYRNVIEDMDEKYKAMARKAKNAKIKSYPKSCTMIEYREATAFEALVAGLYIDGKIDMIKKIFKEKIEGENEKE